MSNLPECLCATEFAVQFVLGLVSAPAASSQTPRLTALYRNAQSPLSSFYLAKKERRDVSDKFSVPSATGERTFEDANFKLPKRGVILVPRELE
jgi:hypothetical protein